MINSSIQTVVPHSRRAINVTISQTWGRFGLIWGEAAASDVRRPTSARSVEVWIFHDVETFPAVSMLCGWRAVGHRESFGVLVSTTRRLRQLFDPRAPQAKPRIKRRRTQAASPPISSLQPPRGAMNDALLCRVTIKLFFTSVVSELLFDVCVCFWFLMLPT